MKEDKHSIKLKIAEAALEYFRILSAMRKHRCAYKNSEEPACRFTDGFPQEDWCEACKNRWPAVKIRTKARRKLRDLITRFER